MFGKPGQGTRKAIRGLMELDLNGLILDLSEEEVAQELRFHRWPRSRQFVAASAGENEGGAAR